MRYGAGADRKQTSFTGGCALIFIDASVIRRQVKTSNDLIAKFLSFGQIGITRAFLGREL